MSQLFPWCTYTYQNKLIPCRFMEFLKYVAIIFYLIKKNVPLSSLETKLNLLIRNGKKEGGKK